MPSKRLSWKNVIQERQKDSFIGRADYLKQFSDNFAPDIPNYLLFFVIGEGGVGKSTLLKQFESIGKNPEIDAIVITCDDKQSSPVAAMGYIAEQLAKFDINSKDFTERYKIYRARRDEIESDPKAPRGALNLVVRGMTDFAIKAARRAPGIGVFAEYLDEKEAGDALTQGVNYLVDRIGNKDEVQLLREPERILTPLFIELINHACEEHRLVLMLDVFERTREALEPWLLELLDFKFGEFDTGSTFVISGRDTVDQRWTRIASSICYITLEPFTFEETRSYLNFRKITNKQLVRQIFEDTGGLPVLVELLAGTNPKPGSPLPDISKDAVKRFLQWIPEEERRWVALLAAVPHTFNLDILSAVLGNNANNDFNWLSVQSYIRTSNTRGWFYHEKVRELMLRYLHNTRPSDLIAAHNRLASFFESQQEKMELKNKEAYSNKNWRELEIEKLYHLLSEQPDRYTKNATNAFLEAFRWRWVFAEKILQVCQQVEHETVSQDARKIIEILGKFYQAYDKDEYEDVLTQANVLTQYSNLSTTAKAALFSRRGDAFLWKEEYEQALTDFDYAITLDENYDFAFARRGYIYQKLGNNERALADLDRAVELDNQFHWALEQRGIVLRKLRRYEESIGSLTEAEKTYTKCAVCIAERGETYLQMRKYEQALADFDRAIALDKDYQWALAKRGETYSRLGKYDQAIADFNHLITLDEKNEFALAKRGEAYLYLRNYEDALRDFKYAITLNNNNVTLFGILGETFYRMKEYEQALVNLSHAITLDDKYISAFIVRGKSYLELGKYEQAIADFDHVISLDENNITAINERGFAYQQKGKYEDALVAFDHAITVDNENHWAYEQRGVTLRKLERYEEAIDSLTQAERIEKTCFACLAERGETYLQMGNREQALVDFSHAIALNNKNAWLLRARGRLYRQLGKYEQALADFDSAISLDKNDGVAFAQRGYIYRKKGKYEQAIADFDRAIALVKDYEWALVQRGCTYQDMDKYEQALADLDSAITLNENDDVAFAERGDIYQKMGNYEQALADFNRAIELDSKFHWAYEQRGIVLRNLDRFNEAIDSLTQAKKTGANCSICIIERAITYKKIGEFDLALADFQHAIEIDEKSAWAFEQRAKVFRELQNMSEALNDINEAIEIDPENCWYHYQRSLIYHLMQCDDDKDNDIQTALQLAIKKKEEDPYNKVNLCNLGLLYLASGQEKDAKTQYDEVLSSGIPLQLLHECIDDINELSKYIPNHNQVNLIRGWLKAKLAK